MILGGGVLDLGTLFDSAFCVASFAPVEDFDPEEGFADECIGLSQGMVVITTLPLVVIFVVVHEVGDEDDTAFAWVAHEVHGMVVVTVFPLITVVEVFSGMDVDDGFPEEAAAEELDFAGEDLAEEAATNELPLD